MSVKCDICDKRLQRGSRVSHAHNVTHRTWQPNLQRVRAVVDGKPCRMRVCTRCLKKGLVQKRIRPAKPPAEVTGS